MLSGFQRHYPSIFYVSRWLADACQYSTNDIDKNALYADFVRRSSYWEEEKREIAVRREFLELIVMNVVIIL
jgi:hypothetical protein